jgi:hypothetical protein
LIARKADNQAIWKKREDMKAYQIVAAIDPTMAGFLVTVIHCTQPHPIGTKQDHQHNEPWSSLFPHFSPTSLHNPNHASPKFPNMLNSFKNIIK